MGIKSIIFGLLLLPLWLSGQNVSNTRSMAIGEYSYSVRPLSTSPAIPKRQINAIYQDSKSFVWVATSQGLYCIRGDHTIHFGTEKTISAPALPSSNILGIAEDYHGNLWVNTAQGIVILDSNRRTLVPLSSYGISNEITHKNNIRLIAGPDESVLFSSHKQIYYFGKNGLTLHTELPDSVGEIIKIQFEHTTNRVYYITSTGLFHSDLTKDTAQHPIFLDYFVVGEGIATPLSKVNFDLINNPNGSCSIVIVYSGIREIFQIPNSTAGFLLETPANEPISAMSQVAEANQSIFPEFNFIKTGKIRAMLKDAYGTFWIGTEAGIFLVEKRKKMHFGVLPEVNQQSIRSIFQDEQNRLWVCSYNGVHFFNRNHQLVKFNDQLQSIRKIVNLGPHRKLLALENPLGAAYYDPVIGTETFFPFREDFRFVYDILETDSSLYLLGRGNLLFQINKSAPYEVKAVFEFQRYPEAPVNAPISNLVKTSDGRLWAMGNAGLYQWTIYPNGRIEQLTPQMPKELTIEPTNELVEDNIGNYWISSLTKGVALYQPITHDYQWINTNTGLASNTVYSLLFSPNQNTIWAGTVNGLSAIHTRNLKIRNFHEEDGIASNEFNSGATYQSPNGMVYLGGINGVTYFDSKTIDLQIEKVPIRSIVQLSSLNGKQVQTIYPTNQDHLVVPPSMELIEIAVSGGTYFAPAKSFRYRLVNGEWKYFENEEKINLNNLNPGSFTFEMQAMNSSGTWSDSYFITLLIKPFFYETWWFYVLIVLLIIGISYLIFRAKLQAVRKELEMRQTIADEIHDNLGNKIYLLRAIAYKLTQNPDAAEAPELQQQLSSVGTLVMNTVRDMIWTMEPRADNLESLHQRITKFANQFIQPLTGQLNILLGTDPNVNIQLSQTAKMDILMIIQEVLSNMVKHTFSQKLEIKILVEHQFLKVLVTNKHNGQKTPKINEENGMGLASIQRRLKRLNATMKRQTTFNEDKVELLLPTKGV